jgi:hypothetical protein
MSFSRSLVLVPFLLNAGLVPGWSAAPTVVTTNEGITITAPNMTPLTVGYPTLQGEKLTGHQLNGTTATLTYDLGTTIAVKVGPNGTVSYHFQQWPLINKGPAVMLLPIDPSFAQGGTFRANDADPVPFPATAPAKPLFFQQNQVNRLAIHDAQQHNLVIHLPGHSYFQITDNRDQTPPQFTALISSPIMSPDMAYHVGDPPSTRSAANQPLLTIPRAKHAMTIDGKTEDWAGIPAVSLAATREVGGQDGPTQHAPSWSVPKSLEGQSAAISASFRVCYDDANLYVLADVTDPTPLHNPNTENHLWAGDALELFFGTQALDQDGDLLPSDRQVLLGADTSGSLTHVRGMPTQPKFPSVAIARPGGYIVETAIPLKDVLGLVPAAGTKLRFDIGIDDSLDGKGRHAQLMWNGTNQNSNERTNWGWAILGK